MRAAVTGALLTCALAPMGWAAEPPLPLALRWSAPPQCPSTEEVRREVERQVHVATGRTPLRIDAEAHVEAVDGRWRVELHTTRAGVEGHQTLEDDSCELLARATALVLALALYDAGDSDPRAAAPEPRVPTPEAPRAEPEPRRRAPQPAPEPAAALQPELPRAEPAQPAVVSSPRAPEAAPRPIPEGLATVSGARTPRQSAWALGAGTRIARGPLPGTTIGIGVGVDVGRGRWLVRLRLEGGAAPEQAIAAAPEVRARYRTGGASLEPCLTAAPSTWLAISGCAELDAAVLFAASSGAPRDGSSAAAWFAIGPAAHARLRLSGRARLELGAGLGVSLDRPRFALGHLGDVYEVQRLAPSATLGLSVAL